MRNARKFSFIAAIAAVCIGVAVALLSTKGASAGKPESEECGMDAVSQSVCVYRLILDDIDANVTMRGGGGVTAIVQTTDDVFEARLAQEGHEDIRSYTVEFPQDGAPRIAGLVERTKSY